MDGTLVEMFRYHAWATAHLLTACRALPPETLGSSTTGTFGTILDTFSHLVRSDGGYLRALGGTPPPRSRGKVTLDALAKQAARLASSWEELLTSDADLGRTVLLDKGTYEAPASIVITQAIHHGDLHREQICAILSARGIEPPDLQPWAFADATDRLRSLET